MGPTDINVGKRIALVAGQGAASEALKRALDEQLLPQPSPDLKELGTDLRTDHHRTGLNHDHRNINEHMVRVFRSENGRAIGAIAQKLPQDADFSNSAIAAQAAKNLYASHKAEAKPTDRNLTRREIRAAARAAIKQIAKSQKEAARAASEKPSR